MAFLFVFLAYGLASERAIVASIFIAGLVYPLFFLAILLALYAIARTLLFQFEIIPNKEPQPEMKERKFECLSCGAEVTESENRCPKCGKDFVSDGEDPAKRPGSSYSKVPIKTTDEVPAGPEGGSAEKK